MDALEDSLASDWLRGVILQQGAYAGGDAGGYVGADEGADS